MENFVALSILIVAVQLLGSYLRWLPFSKELSRQITINTWIKIFIWSLIAGIIYFEIFWQMGMTAINYKLILLFGELPHMAILFYSVGKEKFRHIFVYNLVALWIFIVYAVSTIIVALLFINKGWSIEDLLFIHIEFSIVILVLLLPTERHIFKKIYFPTRYFRVQPQAKYLSCLPLVLLIAHFIRLLNDVFFQSWEEILSRLYLPFVFIFLYRYIAVTTRLFYQRKQFNEVKRQMKEKLFELKSYSKFLQNKQETIRVMRHDLRHIYRLIYALIADREIDKAREFIITQKIALEAAEVRPFCKSDLVNAALEFFFVSLKGAGIELSHKIKIPETFSTIEDDFAVLIGNLAKLELRFSEELKNRSKKIILEITYEDGKFSLEMKDNFSPRMELDEEGFPVCFEIGEIKKFLEKYNAVAKYNRIGEKTKFSICWED